MIRQVLVIDDDRAVRDALVQTLELADCSVISAGSFVAAKDYILPDFDGIILSDIRMSGRDGFHVLNYSREVDHDLPVVLLPLLNDLRAARGESLLSETSLFKPDLSEATGQGQIPDDLLNDPRFILLAKKIRQMFQIALLGVLRNDNMGENLGYMAKVFTKLEQVTGDAPRAPLWSISNALVEGLSEDAIILGTSVKLMLGHVDRNLRELAVEGAASLNRPAPTELIKNLLYLSLIHI